MRVGVGYTLGTADTILKGAAPDRGLGNPTLFSLKYAG